MEKHLTGLREGWQTNLLHQAALPERTLDWPSALKQLLAANAKLKQARNEITNAQENVRQVFCELIPSLNMRSGLSKSVKSLPATSVDDVRLSLESFFNIPGLASMSARLYTARLLLLRAETACRLIEREQTIALYKLYFSAQEVADDSLLFQSQKTTAEAVQQIDPFTGRMMVTETELRELGNRKDKQAIQDQAAEILGDRSWRWHFSTNDLPELPYDREPLPMEDTNRVAQLQMKLVAIELEAARAQIVGIKLRYWPELNVYVTGPPVYQRASGRDLFWEASEIRASADLFWNIDTRGYISRQLRQTRRQQELQFEALRQQSLALIDRLLFTRKLLESSQEKVRQVDQQLRILLAIPPAQNYAAIQKYAADYHSLTQNQRRLRRELIELKTLFWFVDENAWNKPLLTVTKQWQ